MKIGFSLAACLVTFSIAVCSSTIVVGQTRNLRRIELEIYVDQRAPIDINQRWVEVLGAAEANRVVLKVARLSEPTVEQSVANSVEFILIKGKIDRNRLQLPGASFSLGDEKEIREWFKKIREDGVEIGLGEKQAFGLTAPQLVDLHDRLSVPVGFKTRGMTAKQFLDRIAAKVEADFEVDSAARTALEGSETILEEFEEFSLGTAVAAVVRPLGLVFQPSRKQGEAITLQVVDSQTSTEHWPIGWPIEEMPVKAEPKLFERLDLEIRGFPLKTTLDAFEKRTGVPFVYDQNSIAREGIDLTETKVTYVQNKSSYISAINKVLTQTKPPLKQELRIDEGGKTFLWISPMR